jgi:hypothetical protein
VWATANTFSENIIFIMDLPWCQKNYGEKGRFSNRKSFRLTSLRGRTGFGKRESHSDARALVPGRKSFSGVVAQFQLQGVGVEVVLFLKIGLAVLAHVVVTCWGKLSAGAAGAGLKPGPCLAIFIFAHEPGQF